jgi:predicted phosphodiesterase
MQVYAISDVHADFRDNLGQLEQLSRHSYRADALIVAGDVSHEPEVLRRTFHIFLERFRQVFFVPGNHELWIRGGGSSDSIHKFETILRLCESLGVRTGPEVIGSGDDRVCVVPLFSWYTKPGEGSDSLYRERPIQQPAESVWADDYLVKWPRADDFRPLQYFLQLNAPRVSAEYPAERISFSHFLPRQDLMFPAPGETPYTAPDPARALFNFSTVAGSTLIDQQIRELGSRVHVYGHQHRNRRRLYDGVWYVSNCLGYPEERRGRVIQDPGEILQSVWPVSRF